MTALIDNLLTRFQERFSTMEPDPRPPTADPSATGTESMEPAADAVDVCRKTEHARKGYDLDLVFASQQVAPAAKMLDEAGFTIDMITAVDWPEDQQFELLYDFFHFTKPARIVIRTRISRDQPEMPSLCDVYPGANWHERETAEFFGIRFTGHPNPVHLLLPEDFNGFPLRKDFKPEPEPS